MDKKSLVSKELIFTDVSCESKEELFEVMGTKFIELGICTEGYIEAISKREQRYPTGLVTEVMNVAIPHADPDYVIENKVAIIKLNNPVSFHEMGKKDNVISVRWVFFLLLSEGAFHIVMLQNMMKLFSNPKSLELLNNTSNKDQILSIIYPILMGEEGKEEKKA